MQFEKNKKRVKRVRENFLCLNSHTQALAIKLANIQIMIERGFNN